MKNIGNKVRTWLDGRPYSVKEADPAQALDVLVKSVEDITKLSATASIASRRRASMTGR